MFESKMDFLECLFIVLCLFIPLIWMTCSWVRYYVKTFLVFLIMAFVSVPFALGSSLRPRDPVGYRYGAWLLTTFTTFLNIKWEARCKEKLDALDQGPCIFVCNHQTFLDMIAIMRIWPSRCVPMVKREFIYYGLCGLIGYLTGTVFIDRCKKDKAIETCDRVIGYLKSKNIRLWIFPEGTRGHREEMLPFKKGAFHMAIQGRLPIVPIVISSYSHFYNKKEKKFLGSGLIVIKVLDTIPTEGMEIEEVDELSIDVRSKMMDEFKVISREAADRYARGDF